MMIVASLLLAAPAWGQSASPTQPRPMPNGRGGSLMERSVDIMESGAELMANWFRPGEEAVGSLENPRWSSYESPRHTVMTFIEAMKHVRFGRAEAWPRALGALGRDEDSLHARQVARDLASVFDRLGPIQPPTLIGPEVLEQETFTRFEVFPYAVPHEWVWRELGESPDGSIVVVRGHDGRWVFSYETIAGASALAESMRPITPTWQKQEAKGTAFLLIFAPVVEETPYWGWLALLGVLLAGGAAVHLVRTLANRVSDHLEGGNNPLSAQLARSFAAPLSLALITTSLTLGSMFLSLSSTLNKARWHLIYVMLLITIAWLIVEIIDLIAFFFQKVTDNEGGSFEAMTFIIFRRSMRGLSILVLAIFVLQGVVGVNVAALVTTLGVAGLALSLAGQGPLKNLFGSLSIFVNKPFVVGDWVRFKDFLGAVEDVDLQTTRIRLLSGELLMVPNMEFIDQEVENLAARRYFRREMDISLPYSMSSEQLGEALELIEGVLRDEELAGREHFNFDEYEPEVSITSFESYYINLRAYYWYFVSEEELIQRNAASGWYAYLRHCSLVNQRIREAFEESSFDFAFPTEEVRISNTPLPLQTRSPDAISDAA